MEVQASELRHPLILERKVADPKTQDDWSEEAPRWKQIGFMKAKIEGKTGDERLNASQMVAIQSYQITTRHKSGVKRTDRFRHAINGTIYRIDAMVSKSSRYLVITATVIDR